jgi:hypothetical protein
LIQNLPVSDFFYLETKKFYVIGIDSKVELREDFDKLKISYDHQKNETDLLQTDFHELIENCK